MMVLYITEVSLARREGRGRNSFPSSNLEAVFGEGNANLRSGRGAHSSPPRPQSRRPRRSAQALEEAHRTAPAEQGRGYHI